MRNKVFAIVWISTCVLSVMDTHMFVYPSLSRTLLMELGLLALSVMALCHRWHGVKDYALSYIDVFVLLWLAYILVHFLLTSPHEIYRSFYLIVTLSSVLTLSLSMRWNMLTRKAIENGLILISAVHLLFIIGQATGCADSPYPAYPLIGSNENPSVTALFLVGAIPILWIRTLRSDRSWLYIVLIVASVVCIASLRCRTAYVGLCVEVMVWWILNEKERRNHVLCTSFRKVSLACIVFVFAFVAAIRLYDMKKDSADGRLLIWKLSAKMIVEHPYGNGYGLFDKTYNLRQAKYFSQAQFSTVEKRNANYVYMPYNDYLEHGIEGGVIGMLFLVGFYFVLLNEAFKHRQKMESSVIVAYSVMSLTNFVYGSIQPWLLLMCCASFVSVEGKKAVECHSGIARNILCLIFLLSFTWKIGSMTLAQISLKQLNREKESDQAYARLEKYIGTSEAYWTIRAKMNLNAGNSSKTLECVRRARQYTSSPDLFFIKAACLRHEDDKVSAIAVMDTLSNMLPHALEPKYALMQYNHSIGRVDIALWHAHGILSTEVKNGTKRSADIINEARMYVKTYEEQEKHHLTKE